MNYKLPDLPQILIIDDEASTRLVLEGLLTDKGVRLHFAGSSRRGLELAAEILPDAVILDVMMPGMNGFEVCRRLRANPELAETHIILLTALDEREARLEGMRAGADDFISKPFDGLELQLRLRAVLRSSRFRRLHAERARFAWMVESSETGYLVLTEAGKILYANGRAQKLLNLPEAYENIDFRSQVEKFYQPNPQEAWEGWQENPSRCYLVQPETSKAPAFWALLDALDLPLGQFGSRVVRLSDVTDKIQGEQDMRRFHSIVSHKLRTPVSSLYILMDLLEKRMDSLPVEELKAYVGMSVEESKRLLDAIRDILNFLNAPELLRKSSPFAVQDLEGLTAALQRKLELPPVRLDLPAGLRGLQIGLSRHALELCLEEVLENAKKFHPQHSPQVQIGLELLEGSRLRLRVEDDGAHLTPRQIQWALQPYIQGEKYFTGEASGMGLGIPTVATLLWQAGGGIQLSNRPDHPGVRVDLVIPTAPE